MRFEAVQTDRLIIRRPVLSDVDAVYGYRSLPEVARYQDWPMPYTRERAERSVTKSMALDFPADGEGFNLTVVEAADPSRIVGDVYVGIRADGHTGHVGYTLHPDFWGRGYATEAATAIVRLLFDEIGVHRVESSLHPDNPASARVLENCGMRFEGHTRESFWVGEECSDDWLYGATRADWRAWCDRPRHRPQDVQLVAVTADNARVVAALQTHTSQERFVSPMLGNFRDALVPPLDAAGEPALPWYRAIAADGDIVGFVMLAESTPTQPNPSLWRLLIDRMHQRRGIGSAVLDLVEQRCRDNGATAIEVSWREGPGSPAPMYLSRGYRPSGRIDDGEIHAVKRLDGLAARPR